MEKNNTIYQIVFVCISCVLFLFFAVGIVLNPNGPQRQIFFLGMDDFFADFLNILRVIGDRDPYFTTIMGPGFVVYLPLAYLILYPFSKLDNFITTILQETWSSKMGLMSVFLFTCFSVFLLFMALNLIRKKFSAPPSPYLLVSLVLSYIFFFTVERGNNVILSAAFVAFFICFYDSENQYEKMLAVISLALAAVLKIYPVLFGFLYLEKKQYREIFLSAIITILLAFLPFLFFKRGFANVPQLLNNISAFTSPVDFSTSNRFSMEHSFFFVLNLLKFPVKTVTLLCNIAGIVKYLLCFTSIIFYFFVKEKWIKISLLSMVVIFFPTVSATYCGLYLFPMIVIFFSTLEERSKIFNIFTLIVFIVFLNPYQVVLENNKSVNYIFVNFALLALWLVLLKHSGEELIRIKNEK